MRPSLLQLRAAAAFGLAAQLLFFGQALGLNALVAEVLFLALGLLLRRSRLDPRDAPIPLLAVCSAAPLAVRTEPALVAFDTIAGVTLGLMSVAAFAGTALMRLPVSVAFRQATRVFAAATVGARVAAARERAHLPSVRGGWRRAAGYVAGVALAIPFLVAFGLLFASADEVFAHAVREAFDPRRWPAIVGEMPGRVTLAIVVAWIAAGSLSLLWRDADTATETARRRPLGAETATALVLSIDLLFVVFVALQATYLFGGRDTLDAAGVAYSAYARRGFFELLGAGALVAGLLFAMDLLTVRRVRAYVFGGLTLLAATGAILVSAAYRLDLYQQAYGWSEQRFYAFVAVVAVGLALLVLAWGLAADRVTFTAGPIAVVILLVAAGANAIGPSGYVARANVERVLDPSGLPDDAERRLDVLYLYRLGDAAIPELVAALPALPFRERVCLDALLRLRISQRDLAAPTAWQGWNLDRERAASALRGFAAGISTPVPIRDHPLVDPRLIRRAAAFLGCRS